jgi:hypothetical protein
MISLVDIFKSNKNVIIDIFNSKNVKIPEEEIDLYLLVPSLIFKDLSYHTQIIYENEVYLNTIKKIYYKEGKSISKIVPYVERLEYLFCICGNNEFSDNLLPIDPDTGKEIINFKYNIYSKYCYEDDTIPEEVKKIIKFGEETLINDIKYDVNPDIISDKGLIVSEIIENKLNKYGYSRWSIIGKMAIITLVVGLGIYGYSQLGSSNIETFESGILPPYKGKYYNERDFGVLILKGKDYISDYLSSLPEKFDDGRKYLRIGENFNIPNVVDNVRKSLNESHFGVFSK